MIWRHLSVNAKREVVLFGSITGDCRWSGVENRGGLVDYGLIDHSAATARRFTSTPEMMAALSLGSDLRPVPSDLGGLCLRLARWPVDGGNCCPILWN